VLSDARGPFGRNVPLPRASPRRPRGRLRHAVVTTAHRNVRAGGKPFLERGDADFVGAARPVTGRPDWFRKIPLGYGHLVRRCEFTNYCEGLTTAQAGHCKLWDV